MKTKTYIVEMPEDFIGDCSECPFYHFNDCNPNGNCPLAHAKPAVEIKDMEGWQGKTMSKPVKLYAAEDK